MLCYQLVLIRQGVLWRIVTWIKVNEMSVSFSENGFLSPIQWIFWMNHVSTLKQSLKHTVYGIEVLWFFNYVENKTKPSNRYDSVFQWSMAEHWLNATHLITLIPLEMLSHLKNCKNLINNFVLGRKIF